jgi:hypothetical protein
MQSQDFEHLTQREWREIQRWSAWTAKIQLDQAVDGRRKAVVDYCAGEKANLEDWNSLQQAVGREAKARQKYHNALADFKNGSPNADAKLRDVPLMTLI